jgi:hypothetical protein
MLAFPIFMSRIGVGVVYLNGAIKWKSRGILYGDF